jgi:hypothetical protein
MKLNASLKRDFKSVLDKYLDALGNPSLTGEIDFLNRTVFSFNQVQISSGKQQMKIRSQKINQTQIRFYPYGPLYLDKYTTVELGDLLFIYKHIFKGETKAYRAVLIHLTFTKRKEKSWSINTDQFSFHTQWQRFKITPLFTKWYSLNPRMLTWATYGFLGPQISKYPFFYSTKRMRTYVTKIPLTSSFTFPVKRPIGWDSSTSFLNKFVQGFIGENLLTNVPIKMFIEDLQNRFQRNLNHPRSGKMNQTNDEINGFGIIQFTVTSY